MVAEMKMNRNEFSITVTFLPLIILVRNYMDLYYSVYAPVI